MPLFQMKSQSQTYAIPDPAADYRSARRAAQFRFSDRAIYFPAFPGTRYVPYEAVTRALTKNTAMALKGSCGKELPMVRLRVYYDGEAFYQDFLFEHLKEANQVLDRIQALRSEIPVERETSERRSV